VTEEEKKRIDADYEKSKKRKEQLKALAKKFGFFKETIKNIQSNSAKAEALLKGNSK